MARFAPVAVRKLSHRLCRKSLCQRSRWRHPGQILHDEAGSIAILMGIVAPVVIAAVGLGVDVGVWYKTRRAMQNAADSAVIAAAINDSATYASEAKAVAAQYGFVDGANGVTVTASSGLACPDGTSGCYKVNVAQAAAPSFFSAVLGVKGPAIGSAAMANGQTTDSYCLIGLANSGTDPAIRANGNPNANMNGCSVMSNTGADCNGHDLGALYGDAHGTSSGCGQTQHSNVPKIADPFSSLAGDIPPNTCSSYKTEDKKGNGANQWSANQTLSATTIICGDLKLTTNVTLTTASPGSVLVIENGTLDLNNNRLMTASGSALTIIFSGDNAHSANHYPTDPNGKGSGILDIMAPISGTWSGIAIYQNPSLTSGINFTYHGNSPQWNVTGAVYFPNAGITISGAINKSTNGVSCLLFVADNVTFNGTSSIEKTTASSCLQAGVSLPTNTVGGVALVQ